MPVNYEVTRNESGGKMYHIVQRHMVKVTQAVTPRASAQRKHIRCKRKHKGHALHAHHVAQAHQIVQ